MARKLSAAEKERRRRERERKRALNRASDRLSPKLKVGKNGVTIGTEDVSIRVTSKGIEIQGFGLTWSRAWQNRQPKRVLREVRRALKARLKFGARNHVDSIIDRVLRQYDKARPASAFARDDDSATFIQRSRDVSSEEKAIYHNITGAGRSRVIRRFMGLTKEDEQAIHAAFEKAIAEQFRKLSGSTPI